MCNRQTVFFTAVNPLNKEHKDPYEIDLTKPRLASYKQKWKRHQDTVYCPQRGARAQQFIIGEDETELDLSLGSRSFLDRVNDHVRKRQKRSSMNVTEDGEKHSVIW